MAFWRKKEQREQRKGEPQEDRLEVTEVDLGDMGRAEIRVAEPPGEVRRMDITLKVNETYAHGLDFQHKRERLGLHHPETLRALHLHAVGLGARADRRDDAVELLDWLVAARAADEETRLTALNDLAGLLRESGSLPLAEQRLREALSGWERLRGQDHDETLRTASQLARILLDLGRREEAEGLMRDTVARRVRTLGAAHPSTLSARNVLAGALRGSPARLADAESMYRAILADIDAGGSGAGADAAAGTAAGTGLAMAVRNNLAAVLTFQGRHEAAAAMYEELIGLRSRELGDRHPQTLTTRRNLAAVLHSLGRVAEGEALLVEVLDGLRQTRGPRHTETLATQVSLAATLANQNRAAEAVPLLRDAIEGYAHTHGPQHPRVRELASVLQRLTATP
ncbi:tetratricopeptide repeat protein [Streptomyces sp. NPDC056600]|uniref:tetratricopeptide repeat protein n=1 Tax=Streptomyces sp. NPDC056600 TaxID=3345874 RepID=UPI0036D1AB5E